MFFCEFIILQNVVGSTALCISSQSYRLDIVLQLLEAGADPYIICHEGFNPFVYAVLKEFFPLVTLSCKCDTRKMCNENYTLFEVFVLQCYEHTMF